MVMFAVAFAVPMFLGVIVYCAPFCPWVKLPTWVFVTVRSDAVTDTVVGSVAVYREASPPPMTVTVLVPEFAAAPTVTASVITG